MSSLRVDSIESVTPESSLEIKSDLIMIGAMSATTIHVGDSAILSSGNTITLKQTGATVNVENVAQFNNFSVLDYVTSATINFSGDGSTVQINANPRKSSSNKTPKTQGIISVGDEFYFDTNSTLNINTYNFDSGATVTVSSGTINLYETANTLTFNGETTVNNISVFDGASSPNIFFSGGGGTVQINANVRKSRSNKTPKTQGIISVGDELYFDSNANVTINNYTFETASTVTVSSGTLNLYETANTLTFNGETTVNNITAVDTLTSSTVSFYSGGSNTMIINAGGPRSGLIKLKPRGSKDLSIGDEYYFDSNANVSVNNYNFDSGATVTISSGTINLYETANTLTFNGETTVNNITAVDTLTSSTVSFYSGGSNTMIINAGGSRGGLIKLKPRGSKDLSIGDELYFDANANVTVNNYTFETASTVTVSSGTINLYETANTLTFNGETTVNNITAIDTLTSGTINFYSGGNTTIINSGPSKGLIKLKPKGSTNFSIGNNPTYDLGNNSTLNVNNYSLYSGGSIVAATGATVNLFETGNTVNISGTNTINNYNIYVSTGGTEGGVIVSVSGISGNANKLIKVKSDETGFDFITNSEGYETITYADALALEQSQTGGTLTPNKWYKIEASSRGSDETTDFNTYGDIFLKAISSSRFSPDGYLLAINADYNGVGDYTDTGGFITNLGVAYEGMLMDITSDVLIFNNRHWYPTGFFGAAIITSLNDIVTLCTPLTKDYQTKNGYIIEPQKIIYDILNNKIIRMEDKRGNVVNSYFNDITSIERFRFGDNNVISNYIDSVQTCEILNYPNYPNLVFAKNHILNGSIVNPPTGGGNSGLVPSGVTLSIQNCRINDFWFSNNHNKSMYMNNVIISDSKIIGAYSQVILSSSTIHLGNIWLYEQNLSQTASTFNGTITAITLNNQVTNYNTKHRFINGLFINSNVRFQNSQFLKTYSGLTVTLKPGDDIEFKIVGDVAYQTDVNIYI
jgi:hypothetical protein